MSVPQDCRPPDYLVLGSQHLRPSVRWTGGLRKGQATAEETPH